VYDSTLKTLFFGKKIIYLPSCHSTNDIAAELVHTTNVSEGTVVITDEQTAGRGQRGTQWQAGRGHNFTLSIVLKPSFLALSDQFLLSQAVALGVRNYVAESTKNVYIKWPNDIYVNELKLGGILIESSIQGTGISHSIVGIGLNINQADFQNLRATSLRLETGHRHHLPEELPKLLQALESVYLRLRQGQAEAIRREYLASLLGYGQARLFRTKHGEFEGVVCGVAPTGQLLINKADGTPLSFDIKEVEWVWES
jgi:BirA family transcriptional regulator, biotin operon repressor / biotin---[acetyl-CoA-carboxylase] ligase